jgi:ElaB/YqjD/DUF883 family membrane-anchored ribosome-binding protein
VRIIYMINQNGDEFIEDDPLAAPRQARPGENVTGAQQRLQQAAQKVSEAAGDTWEQTKVRASAARERTEVFLRENPVPTILGALAIGLAVGLAIRYAANSKEEEIETKSPLGNLNWGFLSLPFLWPLFKSAREKYEESTDVLKDGVGRLRKIDIDRYAKPIRKRWKAWTH